MPTSHSKFTTGSIPAGMHHRASAIAYNPGQLAARRREGRARVHGGLSQSSINFPRAPAVATTVATPLAVAPAPSSPPVPAPASATRFADLSFETQLETALEIIHDVGRLGAAETEAKIERYLAKISPPSPAVERGIKREPIVLSPAGKFQRLMDAAAA